jgi:carboxymethylenebutenolidase
VRTPSPEGAHDDGEPRGALVIIQEIFGVNSHIRRVTDGSSAGGYVALASAIFDRAERDFVSGCRQEDIDATLARTRTLDFLKQYLG